MWLPGFGKVLNLRFGNWDARGVPLALGVTGRGRFPRSGRPLAPMRASLNAIGSGIRPGVRDGTVHSRLGNETARSTPRALRRTSPVVPTRSPARGDRLRHA